jgi:NADPH:quinone reductase-like Zn-dependent oxidoreductase
MKAVVQTAYGPPERVLAMGDVATPQVEDDGVLIRVRAASLHAGDYFLATGVPWLARTAVGIPKPRAGYVVGLDAAGVVEQVGAAVTRLAPGDEVFAECSPRADGSGACAEMTSAPEDNVVLKPQTLTFEEAAALPVSGLAALHGLRDAGKVQPGQHVLVVGAAGGVGTFAVQIAKWLGAEVTGVCSSANADLVRSLGADHVIDYTVEDFTSGGPRYDLILDNVGDHSLRASRRALKPNGRLLPNSGRAGIGYFIAAAVVARFVRQQAPPYLSVPNREDMELLGELAAAGTIKPVVGKTFAFEDTPAALAHVGTGHARGKVVVTL